MNSPARVGLGRLSCVERPVDAITREFAGDLR
jgi:hypothetical protein